VQGSASVHIAIADIYEVDINGNRLEALPCSEELMQMLAATDSGVKEGVVASLEADEYKLRVDGIHSQNFNWLEVISDAGDRYNDSFTDTSDGAESDRFAVAADNGGQALTAAQKAEILSWYDVNALDPSGDININVSTPKDSLRIKIKIAKPIEVLYAVDGTSANAASNTNVWQFYQRDQGPKWYWDGPGGGPNAGNLDWWDGTGSPLIVQGVENQIRNDYISAMQQHTSLSIDLEGWSRGAVILATVARDLYTTGFVINGVVYDDISVHWVGLFDAVSQMGSSVTTPGGWATAFSPNIVSRAHLIHTNHSSYQETAFPTEMGFQPLTLFWLNGSQTSTHSDVGRNAGALAWMVGQAQAAGVPVT
jgi:hypothetical protein